MHTFPKYQRGISRPVIGLIGLLAIAVGIMANLWWQQQSIRSEEPFTLPHGTYLYDQGIGFPAFDLLNQYGKQITNAEVMNQWHVWFFGFTHCPDICPMSMSTLSAVKQKLANGLQSSGGLKIVFVTVDPERDQPQRLHEYVNAFDEDILGITGTPQGLEALRKSLGIIAVKVETDNSAAGPLFDHSSSVYLTAPDGRIAALFPAPHDVNQLADSIQAIQQQYAK